MIKLRRYQNLSTKLKKDLSSLNLIIEVTLPNSISYEKRSVFLINELEKVTYRCINPETKKIDSITFQNFQKLFFNIKMTWKDKKPSLYTQSMRTLKERKFYKRQPKILIKMPTSIN